MRKLKLLIAIDSFKESLSSIEAATAFEMGFKKGYPASFFKKFSISDGGEGFTESITGNNTAKTIVANTVDPLNRKIKAGIGLLSDKTAIIETAASAGLALLKNNERNPMLTTTYGLGILIVEAVKKGAKKVVVGLGGSATNDGGTGMLQALGVNFFDKKGNKLPSPMNGALLESIHKIDITSLKYFSSIKFTAACDVNNPLTGSNGASRIFGPQKGASPGMIRMLDKGLMNFSKIASSLTGNKNSYKKSGAGAAGGLGYAFTEFLDADLKPGINIMLETCNFTKHLKEADLVITGEGRIDGQTGNNKAPYGIAMAAQKQQVPVIAVCGSVTPEASNLLKKGCFSGIYPITPGPVSLKDALDNAHSNMVRLAESLGHTIRLSERLHSK